MLKSTILNFVANFDQKVCGFQTSPSPGQSETNSYQQLLLPTNSILFAWDNGNKGLTNTSIGYPEYLVQKTCY